MGDRGEILVKDRGEGSVYLYTHWDASDLVNRVRAALAKHWRWDDAPYLARIIFDEMTRGSRDEETGYGISASPAGDTWRVVEVNCSNQMVRVIDHETQVICASFDDFIKEESA